jgi:LacI family transcriptional regulator
VQAAIAALDFRPSSIGRALSKQSLGMIGLFVPSFRGNFYGTILETTDNELRAVHRHMVVANGSGEGSGREQALDAIDFLISRDCDGIVVISHELNDDDLIRIRGRMPKLVVLNRSTETMGDACFSVDHRHGGELAAHTLIEHGHRKLAVIAGPTTAPDNLDRIEGFLSVVAEHGIRPSDIKRVESNFTPDGGWRAMKALLDQGRDFTGLFCANDDMAIGALSYLRHTGISVPNDLSIVGYDDVDAAAHTAPTLTSVHIPMEEMTANAVHWLINQCYGGDLPVERDFPVSISERNSVAHVRSVAPSTKGRRKAG